MGWSRVVIGMNHRPELFHLGIEKNQKTLWYKQHFKVSNPTKSEYGKTMENNWNYMSILRASKPFPNYLMGPRDGQESSHAILRGLSSDDCPLNRQTSPQNQQMTNRQGSPLAIGWKSQRPSVLGLVPQETLWPFLSSAPANPRGAGQMAWGISWARQQARQAVWLAKGWYGEIIQYNTTSFNQESTYDWSIYNITLYIIYNYIL